MIMCVLTVSRLCPETASVDSVINDFYAVRDSIPTLEDIVDIFAAVNKFRCKKISDVSFRKQVSRYA
jgi:hypothetical protein